MDIKEADKLYKNCMKILVENQHPNGGFYASPPGTRYPFIYPRDHSICILGTISAGLLGEAKKGLEFMLSSQKPSGEFSQRYDVDGNDTSYKDLQIDGNGLILYALNQYLKATGGLFFESLADRSFCEQYWEAIEKAVYFILQNKNEEVNLIHTINSIHEYPAYEHGFEIYANSTCCAGLFGAVKIGEALGKDVEEWRLHAEQVKEAILERLYSPRRRSFIKCIRVKYKSSEPIGYDAYASSVIDIDAVEYAPALFGLIDEHDLRNVNTVKRIDKLLWDEELGGLNRYPELWDRNNGGYGPWFHFTCQLSNHYTAVDNQYMAKKYLGWVVNMAHDYMMPEHISTVERFEMWLEDYTNAKILRDSKLKMIDLIKEHPKWKEGFAYVTMPLIWPHAEFIIAYNNYRKKFLNKS
ncbi:MAG: glycoside hydrolase family 15 protein [Methanosarcinales archaeon]|nr:glycoside hydrolase family 15 protein [Methanosarcinales archaeon]